MWIIEDRVFPRDEEVVLRNALSNLDVSHRVVTGVDLRSNTVEVASDDVPRGSCWWIYQLASDANWPKAIWGEIADFSFSRYAGRFRELLLNYPFEKLSFHELCWRGVDETPNSSLFVRPDDGFKSFEGQVVESSGFADWVTRTQLLQIRGSCPVIVAPPKAIQSEWRLVIVDGVIVTGSQYRPSQSINVPNEVKEFAHNAHEIAGPVCRCYVMDIAESTEGLRVIEIGSVNCVAFYAGSPIEIVRAIQVMTQNKTINPSGGSGGF